MNGSARYLAQELSPEGSLAPGAPSTSDWGEYFAYRADFTGANVLAGATAPNALPTAVAFLPFPILIHDNWFEWVRTLYVATDQRVYARFQDETDRIYNAGTLDLRAFAGLANQGPLVGPVGAGLGGLAPSFLANDFDDPWSPTSIGAIRIKPMTTLTIYAADFAGAGNNTVRLTLHGAKRFAGYCPWLYHPDGTPRRYHDRRPYVLPVPSDTVNYQVAANQTLFVSSVFDRAADFLITAVSGVRTGAALLKLNDGGRQDRDWSDGAIHIDTFIGNGLHIHKLPAPRFVRRGTGVSGWFQDLTGATNTIRLFLHGIKLYD